GHLGRGDRQGGPGGRRSGVRRGGKQHQAARTQSADPGAVQDGRRGEAGRRSREEGIGQRMDRTWYWKAGLIVAVTVLSVWALVPSITYFRLPAAERNEASVFEKARPKWAPAKHLNLGLDLQGGIHLVMGVEVDRAVREKAVRRAEEIAADLERRDVKGAEVRGDPETGIVTVTARPEIVSRAKDRVTEDYQDMYVRSSSSGSFSLSMRDDAVK